MSFKVGGQGPFFQPDLKVDEVEAKIKMNFVDEEGKSHSIRVKTFSNDFAGKAKAFFYTKILRTYVETKNPTMKRPILVKVSKAAAKLGISENEVREAAKSDDFQSKVLALRGQKQTQVETPVPELRTETLKPAESEKGDNRIEVQNMYFIRQIDRMLRYKDGSTVVPVYYNEKENSAFIADRENIWSASALEGHHLITDVHISKKDNRYFVEFGKNAKVQHVDKVTDIYGSSFNLETKIVEDQKSILDKVGAFLQQK